jgi:mercuric ion transport protein
MVAKTQDPSPSAFTETRRDATKTALAATGLLAAFGVAACCALPVALGALGLSSAGLLAVALLVGPHQLYVLAVAAVCLLGAGLMMWRQHRARRCAETSCARPTLDWLSKLAVVAAVGLLALTFWIESPL